jgi:hypothetical protein
MISLNQYREYYYVYSIKTGNKLQSRFDERHARSVDTELRNDAIAKGIPYTKALYLMNLWNKQGQNEYIYTVEC